MRTMTISLVFALCVSAEAVTRRAVLVGIDAYEPPSASIPATAAPTRWRNLDGAVNDAVAMRDILAYRFAFRPEDMLVLTNAAATRLAILDALRTHLVESSTPGDVAFFYFAGHGSQVINSLSPEINRRDETIVPADSWQGAADIRDKELRALLNAMLDRGATVTVFLDSCHSGSATRGMTFMGKARYIEPDMRDVADATPPGPSPEQRGALVLAATQDWDMALETRDGDGRPHGAFSLALIQTLRGMPVNESAERVFLRIKALIQANGRAQEPVLAGGPIRRGTPLFGEAGKGPETLATVAVLAVNEAGEVELQGGRAIGLGAGCVLRACQTGSASLPAIRLAIDRVPGLNRSWARVIEGSTKTVSPGDLFEIDQWVPPEDVGIRLWIPPETTADATGRALADALRQRIATDTRAVALADTPESAHYVLCRRTQEDGEAFALMLASAQTEANTSKTALPRTTDWHLANVPAAASGAASALFESATRLARIRGWLTLEPPPDNGRFPYRLALRQVDTGERIVAGTVREGQRFGLVLQDENPEIERFIERRFVYVFTIDNNGTASLLFPADGVNVENQFPLKGNRMPVIPLGPETLFEIAPPFGVDSFILLTSVDAIPAPSALEFDGVRTRGAGSTPFARLLSDTGAATRGVNRHRVPANWSIERLTIESAPQASGNP